MRNLATVREQVEQLDDADLIFGYRCAEATAASNLVDYGPDGYDLTQSSSPAVAVDLVTLAATGARDLDGSLDYFYSASASTYVADFTGTDVSFWGFFDVDDNTSVTFFGVGGSGAAGGAQNYLLTAGIDASARLWAGWHYGTTPTSVVATFTDLTFSTGKKYLVGLAKEVDPNNTGKVRVRAYLVNLTDRTFAEQTISNLTNCTTTGNATVAIGRYSSLSATAQFNGRIGDIGFARCNLSRAWFLEQAGRALRRYDFTTLIAGGVFHERWRARVLNSDGEWINLSSLASGDHVLDIEVSESVDNPIATGRLTLARQRGQLSLSPENDASPYNLDALAAFKPLLRPKAEIIIEVAMTPTSVVEEWDFKQVFRGFVQSPDWSRDEMTVELRDEGQTFRDRRIPSRAWYIFGTTGGVPVEGEIGNLLTLYGHYSGLGLSFLGERWAERNGDAIVYTPVATGVDVTEWKPSSTNVLDHARQVVEQFGFDCRMHYDDTREESRLTIFEPDRAAASTSWSFAVGDVESFSSLRITADDIVTAALVFYGDTGIGVDALGQTVRSYEAAGNTTAIDLYGYLEAEIGEPSGGNIDTSVDAGNLADYIVGELADPKVWGNLNLQRFFFPVELGDYYQIPANGLELANATDVAITGYTHKVSNGVGSTTLQVRGTKPVLRVDGWNDRFQGVGKTQSGGFTTSIDAPSGVSAVVAATGMIDVSWTPPALRVNDDYAGTEIHVGTGSSSFAMSSSTLAAFVKSNQASIKLDPSATQRYVRVRHRDRYRETTSAATGTAVTPKFTPRVSTFRAYRSATGGTAITTASTKVECNLESWDDNGDHSVSTYRFTCNRAGRYQFNGHVVVSTAAVSLICYLYKNGAVYSRGSTVDGSPTSSLHSHISDMIDLAVGDYVELYAQIGSGSQQPQSGTYFSGFLVRDT